MSKQRKEKHSEQSSASKSTISPRPIDQSPDIAPTRENLDKILSSLAELELAKNEDDIVKEFLSDCKKKSDALELLEDEKAESLNEFRARLEVLKGSGGDTHSIIKQLFNEKIASNSDTRRGFMESVGEWKTLLRGRKERMDEKSRLTNEITKQINVNTQLKTIHRDLLEKSNEVNRNTKSLIDAEKACNDELKSRLTQTISEVEAKIIENQQDMEIKHQENENLVLKYSELNSHYEAQKNHYEHHLHTLSLQLQLLNAKTQHHQHLEASRKEELLKCASSLSRVAQSVSEMKKQVSICAEKAEEFQSSISKSNEAQVKYEQQKISVQELTKKIESEIEELNELVKTLESNLFLSVSKIQTSEEALLIVNNEVKEKISQCRHLQDKRNQLQTKLNQKSASDLGSAQVNSSEAEASDQSTTIPSSSSSSSSNRMLRDQITSPADEECTAFAMTNNNC